MNDYGTSERRALIAASHRNVEKELFDDMRMFMDVNIKRLVRGNYGMVVQSLKGLYQSYAARSSGKK